MGTSSIREKGMSTKAEMKALRETVGLSQADLAGMVDVNVRTVKRWEHPDWGEPPEDVMDVLHSMRERQIAVLEEALRRVAEGPETNTVQLTYYRSQGQYDELGRDIGPVGCANANARLIADALEASGIEVEWSYPDDPDNIYHGAQQA